MTLVQRQAVEAAARALQGVAVRTPLVASDWVSEIVGAQVRLKCENLQRAGAFKIRGAYNMISKLSPAVRGKGVITYSSGNHGQAVALAARMYGVPAVVVMPTTAPGVKVKGAMNLGADVVLEGTTSMQRHKKALEIAEERGLAMIPPFDHADIIAGQATVGLEILEDWPEVEAVVVPIGGGGLASGVAAYVKQAKPSCLVIGVEPENADAMYQSRQAGKVTTIEAKQTIADGLMPVRPGELTFEHTRAYIDELARVSDEAIIDATKKLVNMSKLIVEYSGAAAVAALASRAFDPQGLKTVAVLSGGNLDPARLVTLVQ